MRVSDLRPGDIMDMIVYVTFKEHRQNNENGWIKLIGKDISGEISIMLFDFNLESRMQIIDELEKNKFVHIIGKVESFKGGINVKADDINFVDAPEDLSMFFKTSREKLAVLKRKLLEAIEDIQNPKLQLAVASLIGDHGSLHQEYTIWPAAKMKHHAYTHGLIEHSLEVMTFALSDLTYYDDVNKDVLIAASLLHDIGKVFEYETNDGLSYEIGTKGKLVPHIPYGSMIVHNKLNEFKVDESITLQVINCILSHHGSCEFGSPMIPSNKESWLLHLADHRSAILNSEFK